MPNVTLFDYWHSSASYRLRIALNLAQIPYQAVSVDLLAGEHRTPAHLARNPQGLVPVLEIDGQRFTQSLAILEYLDETREMGLLPKDPVARAKHRALAQSIAVDVHPVCNSGVAAYADQLIPDQDIRPQWMHRFIGPGLAAFESLLEGFEQRPFSTGDSPGLADICLIPQLYNANRWSVPMTGLDRVQSIAKACAALPAFQAAHPDAVRP